MMFTPVGFFVEREHPYEALAGDVDASLARSSGGREAVCQGCPLIMRLIPDRKPPLAGAAGSGSFGAVPGPTKTPCSGREYGRGPSGYQTPRRWSDDFEFYLTIPSPRAGRRVLYPFHPMSVSQTKMIGWDCREASSLVSIEDFRVRQTSTQPYEPPGIGIGHRASNPLKTVAAQFQAFYLFILRFIHVVIGRQHHGPHSGVSTRETMH